MRQKNTGACFNTLIPFDITGGVVNVMPLMYSKISPIKEQVSLKYLSLNSSGILKFRKSCCNDYRVGA